MCLAGGRAGQSVHGALCPAFAGRADLPSCASRESQGVFWEKTWPGFFPGVFFIRRAPAASESVASQCRGACVFPALALCRRQRCPTERKRVLLRRTFLRAFVNGREMCRSPGAASRPQCGVLGTCAALRGAESRASGSDPSLLRRGFRQEHA